MIIPVLFFILITNLLIDIVSQKKKKKKTYRYTIYVYLDFTEEEMQIFVISPPTQPSKGPLEILSKYYF